MTRIRTIKPDAFTSETLTRVSVHARWTFAGLWTYVDDEGRGKADARLIKAAVWPLDDDVTVEHVKAHLDELEREHAICRFEQDGRGLLHVVNWQQHQRINRPAASRLPECSRTTHGGLTEPSVSPHGALTGGKERKGKERDSATRPEKMPQAPDAETPNQRANRLTRTYTDRRKLSNFPAVAGIVRKALTVGYDDDAITAALSRLADDNRSVTVDALRIELEGLPPSRFARPEPATPGFWGHVDRSVS